MNKVGASAHEVQVAQAWIQMIHLAPQYHQASPDLPCECAPASFYGNVTSCAVTW